MSDLLSIGASGVRAYQSALSVTGENIANSGAAGYVRRSVRLTEMGAGAGLVDVPAAGNGVLMTGIVRSTDVYASQAVRSASADLSRTTAGVQWLDRIEKTLTGNELSARMTGFFGSANTLAAEPDSTALRQGMLSAAESLGIAFTATGQSFDQIDQDMDAAGRQATTQLNALGRALVQINDGLGRTTPNTAAAAQLTDQRDQILDLMSAIVDIDVTTDSLGRTNVKLGGANGQAFVNQNLSGAVAYQRAKGEVVLAVSMNGGVGILSPSGGALAGIVDGAQRVSAAREKVEDVAADFVARVNANQKAGEDQTGAAGQAMFTVGGRPTDIAIALTSGAQIAAADPGGGRRDSSKLTDLEGLRGAKGWEASLTATITNNASTLDQRNTIAAAQGAIRDGAMSALTSTTGVNLDSEAVELMRYQQAYQASSRVIQIARDTLQTILDIR